MGISLLINFLAFSGWFYPTGGHWGSVPFITIINSHSDNPTSPQYTHVHISPHLHMVMQISLQDKSLEVEMKGLC